MRFGNLVQHFISLHIGSKLIEHLQQYHPKRININLLIILTRTNLLGRPIEKSPNSLRLLTILNNLRLIRIILNIANSRKPKIPDLNLIHILNQENIGRFEIAMDDATGVDIG